MYRKPLFGSVQDDLPFCPTGVALGKVNHMFRFFINDHWVDIGKASLIKQGNEVVCCFPNLQEVMERHMSQDDGTTEWVNWGPRVN